MEDLVSFLIDNWKFLVYVVLLLVSVILAIVRRTIVNVIPESVVLELSDSIIMYVNEAEKLFPEAGSGKRKLMYVVERCKDFCKETKVSISSDFVFALVEKILSTPQKKEN